ncbi:hypothetical protein EDB85DRAFT_1886989 [Lactarius pseudohatsudake]|nr:hypothetical protein EDB85DRAFT_1886989 [Lactarius pseudohatsudake]
MNTFLPSLNARRADELGFGPALSACPHLDTLPVAFEPLEYPREEDSHAYSVTTKEELLDWVKNGDQTYCDVQKGPDELVPGPADTFCYKSYADFFLIILDFCIAVASVWPQTSANRMTYRLTKRGLDVLKSRLDDAAGKHAACAHAKTRLERFKLSPWPTPLPSPSYNDTWHRTPPVEAREEYDWIPPAEARERYEEWIYDGYSQPMEYEVWGQPKNDAGYDWHGNQVVWDYYNDEWCMPPAEAREEYEDIDEFYDHPGEAEEYADDQDEEGYYNAQIAVYDEEYYAPDEAAEEYDNYGPWAAAREEHEDYAEEEYEEYEDPHDDAREEYDEEFPAGDVQNDGYDEDWMGPRSTVPPAEKRVHYDADTLNCR